MVKAFSTEELESQKYLRRTSYVLKAELSGTKAYGLFNFFANFGMFGTLNGLIFVAGFLHHKGVMEIG